jgi:O-antigen/teichoic acid export membrane protein
VTIFQKLLAIWKEDNVLRRVVKNSSYLFSSNTISIPLAAAQSILAARTLGVAEFGTLGVITLYATNVNRLLSFRMGEPVVKYMGQFVAQGKREPAAAVVKAAAITEAVTSLFTYLLLFLLAPLIARYFVRDMSAVRLIDFYGLMLVANLIPETSTGILQVGRHFRSQALINLLQNIVTCSLLVWAFFSHGGLWPVLLAYFIGKIIYGVGMTGYAFYQIGKMLGWDWWKVPFKYLPEGRGFWKFAISTNLSGTINLLTRDSEELWVALLLNTTAAGYYKTAKAVMNLMLMPITPFISTTYPELNHTIAQRAWDKLRSLLKRLTWMSFVWNGLVIVILAIFGAWLIPLAFGPNYSPSYPAAMILLIGYGTANILYWNRNLLLSLGHQNYALGVIAIVGALKIGLSFLLVRQYGYLMQATLLSLYLAISVLLITWRGLRLVKQQSVLTEPQ